MGNCARCRLFEMRMASGGPDHEVLRFLALQTLIKYPIPLIPALWRRTESGLKACFLI